VYGVRCTLYSASSDTKKQVKMEDFVGLWLDCEGLDTHTSREQVRTNRVVDGLCDVSFVLLAQKPFFILLMKKHRNVAKRHALSS
jgi:hypothetical protein